VPERAVVALVPAAGQGDRLGLGVPKAFAPVAGEPVLVHAIRGVLATASCVDAVVVAAPPGSVDRTAGLLRCFGDRVSVVAGGATRTGSVRRALDHALRRLPAADVILVHDAARAFAPPAVFAAIVRAVRAGLPAVIPVLPVVDTIKVVDGAGRIMSTVDRSSLRSVQTPQGFAADVLRRAHSQAGLDATDDAALVEALGEQVHAVPGDPRSFKITTPLDLTLAEALVAKAPASEHSA
jgi:2-C-methyl-D-erythritol 4-phosphate cytidylyltransferase